MINNTFGISHKVGGRFTCWGIVIMVLLFCFVQPLYASSQKTIIISAEGLADPSAKAYETNKGLLLDDLRDDAKKQVIEKAVACFVESTTLVDNYGVIHDSLFTQSAGLIKRIIKESDPWLGMDGFMHLLMKAEVSISDVKDSLDAMSRKNRIDLIKSYGNPRISASINIQRDYPRLNNLEPMRSPIAENILKEHISQFGYRVWSENTTKKTDADFSIHGRAKIKSKTMTLTSSKLTLTKYNLTSWTVKCMNNHTGEEIYFNNKIPQGRGWSEEDVAIEDIGRLIGKEFSKSFFEENLRKPFKIYQMHVSKLGSYETALMLKKELIGLRRIINVDLRNFEASGVSLYEVEFSGQQENFMKAINNTVIDPLNKKLGSKYFKLVSADSDNIRVNFQSRGKPETVLKKFETTPPASLAVASPRRIASLVKNKSLMEKVKLLNPEAMEVIEGTSSGPSSGVRKIGSF